MSQTVTTDDFETTGVENDNIAEGDDVVAYEHYELPETRDFQVAESAGNPMVVRGVEHVVVIDTYSEHEIDEMMAAMNEDLSEGQTVVQAEATVFISDDEATVGGGVAQVSEEQTYGADEEPTTGTIGVDAALTEFVEQYYRDDEE